MCILHNIFNNIVYLSKESCTVPEGVSAVLIIMHTHRDSNIWPNPLKFDPDRFLPEEVAKRHPYSYLPFSGGPRNCIGNLNYIFINNIHFYSIYKEYRTRNIYTNIYVCTPTKNTQLNLKLHAILIAAQVD